MRPCRDQAGYRPCYTGATGGILKRAQPLPLGPFQRDKIGHVALYVSDIGRSLLFYRDLRFEVSDTYSKRHNAGGAVFLRCNSDHHGVALFKASGANAVGCGLHHVAFEVPTRDDVVRAWSHLRTNDVPIDFDGRRRASVQIAVGFRDPDDHRLEIYRGIDQIAPGAPARPAHERKGAASLEAIIADPVVGQDTSLKNPSLLSG